MVLITFIIDVRVLCQTERLTHGETFIVSRKNHGERFLTWNHLSFDKSEDFFYFSDFEVSQDNFINLTFVSILRVT